MRNALVTASCSAAPSPQSSPAISLKDAQIERAAQVRKHARDCLLMAVVTSPAVAADLIDKAAVYTRDAEAITCREEAYR